MPSSLLTEVGFLKRLVQLRQSYVPSASSGNCSTRWSLVRGSKNGPAEASAPITGLGEA